MTDPNDYESKFWQTLELYRDFLENLELYNDPIPFSQGQFGLIYLC